MAKTARSITLGRDLLKRENPIPDQKMVAQPYLGNGDALDISAYIVRKAGKFLSIRAGKFVEWHANATEYGSVFIIMMTASTTNLVDVARLAGVSPTTVSRFVNDPQKVKPETRRRIEGAINDLGYVPNGAARALASNRSRIIGAIVPTLNHALFATELNDLERRLAVEGYGLIVASNDYQLEREYELTQTMLSRHVDGLVFVGVDRDPSIYRLLEKKGVPYVTTCAINKNPRHPEIGVDNFAAAQDVADYLLDLGHEDFGVISHPSAHNDRARARLAGFRAAIEARGHALLTDRVIERPVDFVEGQIAFRHLMSLSPRPTAVLCSMDIFAIGAVLESRRIGVRIPDDVSVTGFDNAALASLVEPTLTTIDLPVRETGRRAAEYLLQTLKGKAAPWQSVLDYDLVVRKSAAGPPRQGKSLGGRRAEDAPAFDPASGLD